MTHPRRWRMPFAVLMASALALAGCAVSPGSTGSVGGQSAQEGSASIATTDQNLGIPEGFEDYYTQEITWKKCTEDQVVGEMM